MNSLHLRTFIWLRWRLLIRQLQRGGIANSIVLGILAVLLLVGVLGFSILSFVFGLFVVEQVPEEDKVPAVIMYVWDVMVVFFLITWGAGLIAELQRSEALSLEKFLHLPVSLGGVFVLNYLSLAGELDDGGSCCRSWSASVSACASASGRPCWWCCRCWPRFC